VYDDPPVIIGNSFGIRTEPIKLQYAIGEELDYTGIWVDHLMTYQYVRSTIYNDGFYNDEKFMSLFKDISEKPETIPYSDPIVWPYFYPNYYYVDATDFDNQVPGTYEIRLYGYIAATDAIYEKMDSFYVTVGDGIQTGTATSESTTTPATTTTTTAFTGTMTTTTSDSGKESCGDVDGNSVIDLVDASAVLSAYAQNAAGLTAEDYTGSQLTAADVNGDSKADLADASFILRYYARNAAGLSPTWEEILGA
ncbi:MAG: hypothetical protein IJ512_07140, partial [Ruminococcus sp.]|nr:hypothetical protein [Ruminococcus sp.]